MQTLIDIMHVQEDLTINVSWKRGKAPHQNEALLDELWGLPDTLVIPSFGETSLIIDLGRQTEIEETLEVIRGHGYETSGTNLAA